ncbi:MAG: membrane protein insertase YidC [Candidatus Electrothrix sp. AR4]|nr:membrane protein insertase YidC [Candidatus Electrothrix sp. AR4]
MDMQRAFLAIIISFIILIGYQYYFVPVQTPLVPNHDIQQQGNAPTDAPPAATGSASLPNVTPVTKTAPTVELNPTARDITIQTPLYTAVFFEQGGGLKSFVLKKYQVAKADDAALMEMITTSNPAELPMIFSLDSGSVSDLPFFKSDTYSLNVVEGGQAELSMIANDISTGIKIERHLTFTADSYLIDSRYTVTNTGSIPLQISPAMAMTNAPFESGSSSSRYMFSGPVAYVNNELIEIKPKKLDQGPVPLQGTVSWAAHVDNYFMCALIPEKSNSALATVNLIAENTVRTVLTDGITKLTPGASKIFQYEGYFGPKKLAYLKQTGYDLPEAINFGWFDILAKPMLMLLNTFYAILGNYGIAIILLTCLIKGAFWPITQKGMKSMKNMQKLQPKIAKLKEKYKENPTEMNKEMMALYKTYKVNPVGGCLPMIIQVPFFFALYRVLMAAIELRHAPFMLWINDLSAPDRLMIGFDIPILHGIPVLTILMGASMFLQQKMTPTTADPTQAKIMQFLPIIFTAMFINFASGLVLYWFVNNLLSILQQQLINRQTGAGANR